MRRALRLLVCMLVMCAASCSEDPKPQHNTLTPLEELGRHLFYERRLSVRENRSCGICHEQAKGFTDGFVRAVGSTGDIHPRNTLTLLNTASRETLSWLHPQPQAVSKQLLTPLLGEDPIEHGAAPILQDALRTLNNDPTYIRLLRSLEPPTRRLDLDLIALAIEAFVLQLETYNAPYDRFLRGETHALTQSAQRGATLFFSESTGCFSCHGGADFDTPQGPARHDWFNTGLYNLGEGHYPDKREGLFEITGVREDIGRYRVPTLRHLQLTKPYYHDGTGATLTDVLANYNRGGRITTSGPYEGDGRLNPFKDPRIRPLGLTSQQLRDLEAFLNSLTDHDTTTQERWSDPWERED